MFKWIKEKWKTITPKRRFVLVSFIITLISFLDNLFHYLRLRSQIFFPELNIRAPFEPFFRPLWDLPDNQLLRAGAITLSAVINIAVHWLFMYFILWYLRKFLNWLAKEY